MEKKKQHKNPISKNKKTRQKGKKKKTTMNIQKERWKRVWREKVRTGETKKNERQGG